MSAQPPHDTPAASTAEFDTSSHESFYDYYKQQSLSPTTIQRFQGIADVVLRVWGETPAGQHLSVLDIGCGAGTQSRFWADHGHEYVGVDINEPLIRLARERAQDEGRRARFEVSSATRLPFDNASFDICLLPELLEHIVDWQSCLNEAARVLRPGGLMYVSTSSRLCPKQQEFNLPAYSWYPGFVKRHIERRAVTDWPAVANYVKYPAVNWFSFYQLRRYLAARGFSASDRFDVMRLDDKPTLARLAVKLVRTLPPLRFIGHVLTPATIVVARRVSPGSP